jgi:hypothetical protein
MARKDSNLEVVSPSSVEPVVNGSAAPIAGVQEVATARERIPYWRRALLADVLLLAVAMAVVGLLSPTGSPSGAVPPEPLAWSLAFSGGVVCMLYLRGAYVSPLRLDLLDALRVVVSVTALAAVLIMAGRILLSNVPYVAAETVRHWIVMLPFLGVGRVALLVSE